MLSTRISNGSTIYYYLNILKREIFPYVFSQDSGWNLNFTKSGNIFITK